MSKHTPGPWRWFGNTKSHDIYLATEGGGRIFVMNFVRWGMGGAQPRFQRPDPGVMVKASDLVEYEVPYRKDIVGIDHPDAHLIAAAPELLEALLAMREAGGCWCPPNAFHLLPSGHTHSCELASAALARAEGRPTREAERPAVPGEEKP